MRHWGVTLQSPGASKPLWLVLIKVTLIGR